MHVLQFLVLLPINTPSYRLVILRIIFSIDLGMTSLTADLMYVTQVTAILVALTLSLLCCLETVLSDKYLGMNYTVFHHIQM